MKQQDLLTRYRKVLPSKWHSHLDSDIKRGVFNRVPDDAEIVICVTCHHPYVRDQSPLEQHGTYQGGPCTPCGFRGMWWGCSTTGHGHRFDPLASLVAVSHD